MAENLYPLTTGALECFLDGCPPEVSYLQVINIKKIPNQNNSTTSVDKYRLQLSDSTHYQPCLLVTSLSEKVSTGEIDRYCIIKVEEMIPTVIQGRKILLLKNLSVLKLGASISQVVGKPTSLELRKVDSSENQQTFQSSTLQPLYNSSPDNAIINDGSLGMKSVNDYASKYSSNSCNHVKSVPITAINPYNNNWTICARITAKNPIRKWSNSKGEGKVLGLEFTDASGTIRATAFNEVAVDFDKKIILDKVFLLSKADLRPSNKKFCGNSNHDFELYINQNTEIEECVLGIEQVPCISYCFKLIEEIKCLPKDSTIDFIGVCIESSELVEVTSKNKASQLTKRELILADRTSHKINCTLWGAVAESFSENGNPIILIRSARVSDFNTCSLSVGSYSSIICEPSIRESRDLRMWFDSTGKNANMQSVSVNMGSIIDTQNISEILAAKNTYNLHDKGEIHVFRAMISLFKKDKEIFYKSCPTDGCQKKVSVNEEGGTLYHCDKCSLEFKDFKYRYMLNMEIQDHSGSIWVTSFHESAESIIGIPSDDLGKFIDDNGKFTLESEWDSKLFTTFYLKTRIKRETYNDEDRLRAIVLGVTATDDVLNDCKMLLKKINDLRS